MFFSLFKRTSKIIRILSWLVISILVSWSCTKSEDYRFDTSYNKETTLNFLQADFTFRQIFLTTYRLSFDTNLINTGTGIFDSASVMHSGSLWIMDYGTGRKAGDGSFRAGKILIEWTVPLTKPESMARVSFDNFFINQKQLNGVIRITQTRFSPLSFSCIVDSGIINLNDVHQRKIIYQGSYQYKQKGGNNTPYSWWDDEYTLFGKCSGRGVNGDRYSFVPLDSLRLKFPCRFLKAGRGQLSMPDFEINMINLVFPLASECSAVVRAEYRSQMANGAIKNISAENLTVSY